MTPVARLQSVGSLPSSVDPTVEGQVARMAHSMHDAGQPRRYRLACQG